VWKRLRPGELAAFRQYLEGLGPDERPVYGLLGVKAWWWTRLGGFARPLVVLFRGDRVVVSKRSLRGRRVINRREYRVGDLLRVSVRRGPLLESIRLWFADGHSVRVGSLPRHQSDPVRRFLKDGPAAFDPATLTPGQLTNTYLACRAMGLGGAGALADEPEPGIDDLR
jgi:hypothetical protein